MKILARLCDLCATEGTVRLAKGRCYIDEAKKWYDVCATHARQAVHAGFEFEEFEMCGDVNARWFVE